jgi:hypothetical protein
MRAWPLKFIPQRVTSQLSVRVKTCILSTIFPRNTIRSGGLHAIGAADFGKLLHTEIFAFLDDCCLASKTVEGGIDLLRRAFDCIRRSGLKVESFEMSAFADHDIASWVRYFGWLCKRKPRTSRGRENLAVS